MFEGLYRAQVAWDEVMAANARAGRRDRGEPGWSSWRVPGT